MEFSLWNLNVPEFWANSSNSCNAGETVAHVLCTSSTEELQADDVPYPPSPCADSAYHSAPDFIPEKSDVEIDKDQNCLVTLELEAELDSSTLENDLDIKEEPTFSVSRPSKKLKQVVVIAEETDDTGQEDDIEVAPVDNLWNNGIIGANVNIKTDPTIPVAYQLEEYESIFGRIPTRFPPKRLQALTTDSDDDRYGDDIEEMNDESQQDYEQEEEDVEDEEEHDVVHNLEQEERYGEVEEDEDEEEEDEEEEEEEDDDGDEETEEIEEQPHLTFARSRCAPRLTVPNVGYECGECSFMAETRPGLKKHIATMHPAPTSDARLAQALMRKLSQSTTCPLASCRFRAADRSQMEAHVARHVSGGGQNVAPIPTKKKVAPVNLQRVRYEREEYRCQMCSYSCTIEKAFYKHLKLHSLGANATASKISCVICGKDRPTEVDMNKHMRKHRDNRYFCCDICVFRTVQLKKLIQHRRMHTGEKPHLCPHCPYRSARRDNLRSHVRRVHKKENLFCDTFSPRGLVLNSGTSNSSSHD